MLVPPQHDTFSRGILSLNGRSMGRMRHPKAGRCDGGKIAYQLVHANHKSRDQVQVLCLGVPPPFRPQPCQ